MSIEGFIKLKAISLGVLLVFMLIVTTNSHELKASVYKDEEESVRTESEITTGTLDFDLEHLAIVGRGGGVNEDRNRISATDNKITGQINYKPVGADPGTIQDNSESAGFYPEDNRNSQYVSKSGDYIPELGESNQNSSNIWDGERADDTAECDSDSRVDESGRIESETIIEEPSEDATFDEKDATFEEEDATFEENTDDGLLYLGQWTATAYCPCAICCGEYASGYTASGTLATEGRTIACNELPIGTQVMIDGNIYVVEDTGWSPYSQWLDIYFDSHDSAMAFGVRTVDVYLFE